MTNTPPPVIDPVVDEAETVINASYAVDGATIAAKANDKDEVEVSVSFAF